MMRIGISPFLLGLVAGLCVQMNLPAQTTEAPDFKEVYDLVRNHLGGMSEAELNRAAIRGLTSALAPKVTLVTNGPADDASASSELVLKSGLFDGDIAYVRLGRVGEGLAQALRKAYDGLASTNKLKGLVLDLRFVGGDDYAAAASTVD